MARNGASYSSQAVGQHSAATPSLNDQDQLPLQVDSAGNLLVNVVAGGGSGSNAAAGQTGSAVPSDADYQGVNVGGNLTGVTGLSVGTKVAPTVAIVDASGNQITAFGGSGGNAAAGATGAAVPADADYTGFNSGGNLVGVSSSNPLPVTLANTGANATAVKVDGSGVTQPVSGTFFQATQPVSIAASVVVKADTAGNQANALKVDGSAVTQPVSFGPATSGGLSISHLVSAGSTNATNAKASAGQVFGWSIYNAAAYPVYLKLFNKASAPTPGTDTPVMTVGVQAGIAREWSTDIGIAYGTGIGFAITKGIADNDSTAVLASDCVVDIFYK